jgi:hypothetical protein
MTIVEYYKEIKTRIESGDFKIQYKDIKLKPEKEDCIKNSHLESIHYLMYEYMLDRKDNRKKMIFDYVCCPNGVNEGENDIDFTLWETEEFLREIMKLKD